MYNRQVQLEREKMGKNSKFTWVTGNYADQIEQEEEEAGKGEAGTGTNKYETNRRALERFR